MLSFTCLCTQSMQSSAFMRCRTYFPPGREGFLKEVHRWVDEYGGKICKQMRRLGTSCDWSRQAFTMDEQCSAAVQEAFLRMHADGLIYRDVRLVNWDCILLTAVSDSEVNLLQDMYNSTNVLLSSGFVCLQVKGKLHSCFAFKVWGQRGVPGLDSSQSKLLIDSIDCGQYIVTLR